MPAQKLSVPNRANPILEERLMGLLPGGAAAVEDGEIPTAVSILRAACLAKQP